MTDVVLFKGETGKLEGLGDKGRRAWEKFRRTVVGMEFGETIKLSFKLPRSPRHHRFFMWKLHGLFDRQDRFPDEDRLRLWLTVGAGYCDLVPGSDGQLVALPQSIAFDTMGEEEFVDLHQKIDAFLWTPYAQGYLWPHLDHSQTYEAIDRWHLEFQGKRGC